MKSPIQLAIALTLVSLFGVARADKPASGQQVYERCCRTCHGGTARADFPIGPSLTGIIGTKAGTRSTGVYSRALIDSGIVWNRGDLRRFLSDPARAVPGTLKTTGVVAPAELENLLDYLELM